MVLLRPLTYFLAASTIYSSALAASSLEDVILSASSTRLGIGQMVRVSANTTAPAFMALGVYLESSDGSTRIGVYVNENGISADAGHLPPNNQTSLSGPSDAFERECDDGKGWNMTTTVLPTSVGNWTLQYYIQYFFPTTNGNYTYEEDEDVCIAQPINVESFLAGTITLEVTPGASGTAFPTGVAEYPIATSAPTSMAANFASTPTGEPFNIPSPSSSASSPSDPSPSPSSSSYRRFEARSNDLWAFTMVLFGIGTGFFTLV